jgi:hypothetical protein
LYAAHFDGPRSRYDDLLTKPDEAYAADLRALAVAGAEACRTMLTYAGTRERLSVSLAADVAPRRSVNLTV